MSGLPAMESGNDTSVAGEGRTRSPQAGDAMTMDRALRLWFLALYAIGIVGFLSNVLRIRRHRPAFEQQIGPLPEVGALVAWFLPPLIILSGVGRMTIEQPIVRVLGVVLSL